MAVIEVAVLGQPEFRIDGRRAALQGRSLLLALRLALAGPTPVSRHALLDVWPDGSGTHGALRVALTRLRSGLPDDTVRRVDQGYVLHPVASVDADEFTRLLRLSKAPNAPRDERLRLLDAALDLWRSNAYAGIDDIAWVDQEVVRLAELREQSIDRRFELLLEHANERALQTFVPDLVEEAKRLPEREHRTALAATALYRAGRQADALAVIETTRTALVDRYGLTIGRELRDLELAILRHEVVDPAHEPDDERRTEITRRLHAASGLLTASADEALPIAEEAVLLSRRFSDRENLPRALLLVAQCTILLGHGDPDPFIEEAQRIARTVSDGELLARAALIKFGRGITADRHEALIELAEPLDVLPASASLRVELLCASAAIVSMTDAGASASRLVEAAEREHRIVGSERTEAVWLATRSIVAAVDGSDPDVFRADAERALLLASSADEPILLTIACQAVLRLAYATGDLPRVDAILAPLADASNRALLPFGTVRRHLCGVTNALARGQLSEVQTLIDATREVGHRLGTYSVDAATAAQQSLLEFELDELHHRFDMLNTIAESQPRSGAIVTAALAQPHNDHAFARLETGLDLLAHDDSRPALVALAAVVAAERRSAALGQRCLGELEPLGDRFIAVGFGSLVLGPTRLYAGISALAVGRWDTAVALLTRAIELSSTATGWLWEAHARLWLAETLIERRVGSDVADCLIQLEAVAASPCFSDAPRVQRHEAMLRHALREGAVPISRNR